VCEEGLAAFDINYDQEAEARRARRRHNVSSVDERDKHPASGPRSHTQCKICWYIRCHLSVICFSGVRHVMEFIK